MKKLKMLSVALCLCVCMVIGAVFVGCDNPEQTQEIENLQTQIEQLQTDITNLNNQLEELQTENSQLKEVTAIDVARGIQAIPSKMPSFLNAEFGDNDSVSGEDYLNYVTDNFIFNPIIDTAIFTNNMETNIVYEEHMTPYEQKYLIASEGNWQALVFISSTSDYTIIEFELTDDKLFDYIRITSKTSYEHEGEIISEYTEFELNFNNTEDIYNSEIATFKFNHYEYYLNSETNEIISDGKVNKFIQLEGSCIYENVSSFDSPSTITGIIEEANLYNMKAYNANVNEEYHSEYLYTNTAAEAQLKDSNLKGIIESERQMIDLSGYEVVDLTSASA